MKRFIACLVLLGAVVAGATGHAAETVSARALFRRDNLVAWCIVPFDDQPRSPAERAAMKERAAELKAQKAGADGEKEVLARIAKMPPSDRVLAKVARQNPDPWPARRRPPRRLRSR